MEIKIPFAEALYEVTDEKNILNYRAILSRDSLFYGLFFNGELLKSSKIDVNNVQISKTLFDDAIRYDSIVLAFNNPIYTFVSGEKFDPQNANSYIDFTNHLVDSKKYQICSEYVAVMDLWVVYAIPKRIQKLLKRYLGNYNFTHYQVCNLKSISADRGTTTIYGSRVGDYLNLTLIQDEVLEVSNSYPVRKDSELYYFISLIYDQYKLDKSSVEIILQGDYNNLTIDESRFEQLFGVKPTYRNMEKQNNETTLRNKPLVDLNKCV